MSSDYENNAYIAALPAPLSRPEWVRFLTRLPERDEAERKLSHGERYLCALRVLRFFRAGARQADFARGFDAVLREGYRGRDDSTRAHEARMHAVASAREAGGLLEPGAPVVIRHASSSALLGVPGMGKTATLDGVLARYPQMKRHADGQVQIVWFKLECPAMGSIRQTCRDFFKGVDALLGQETYQKLYAGKHVSDDDLMDGMVAVANIHSLGCLVIDEIQHLGKAGDEQHVLMTFLTTLVNKIGVPVLFVGTMSAYDRFSKTGRMGRRSIGPAAGIWNHYPESDAQWQRFVTELWEYQWTAQYTPPTPAMLKALHDRSQGIVDIVTKLWFAVQVAAMDDSEASGGEIEEIITEEMINEVADRHLAPMEGLLAAVRSGDPALIRRFDDVAPRNEAFWNSLKDVDGPVLNGSISTDADQAARRTGPAYVGQCASVVRENLEWQGFDEARAAEVMRRTSEAVGAPDASNLPVYFARMADIISELKTEGAVSKTARSRPPTKAEVEATFIDGDLRREGGDGIAAAA
ncbi:AAA domain-containing protein [Sphingomonas palmae]|uniref:AAA domain-containing protein n=1 Tax=Sphingomonas palmae TaxID=1855283 RepID=A0A1H7U0U5_9SPHN|nr:ATP-binding protein [Sphingomonas palmae]SEL90690.1 AAA domain-containing protein [Sphingomonas palmae]